MPALKPREDLRVLCNELEINQAKLVLLHTGMLPSEWLPEGLRRQPLRVMAWQVEDPPSPGRR
jgi:hypothetical protein